MRKIYIYRCSYRAAYVVGAVLDVVYTTMKPRENRVGATENVIGAIKHILVVIELVYIKFTNSHWSKVAQKRKRQNKINLI